MILRILPRISSQITNRRLDSYGLLWLNRRYFSKKHDFKGRKEAPKVQQKNIKDYIGGPQDLKDTFIEVQKMQTISQSFLEDQGLKQIIQQQRTHLQQSLKDELNPQKTEQKEPGWTPGNIKEKLIFNSMKKQSINQYYLVRPLQSLQNIYFWLFCGNLLGYGTLQMIGSYQYMGWFFGIFTAPTAITSLSLLAGYNFSFWVVRQAFHLHLQQKQLSKDNISLVSSTWPIIAELSFIMTQIVCLFGCFAFGSPFPTHQTYMLLLALGSLSLIRNLQQTLRTINVPTGVYWTNVGKVLSQASLLLLIYAFYNNQIEAGSGGQNIQSQSFKERVTKINDGYKQFLSFFKQKNYKMGQNEKINPQDDQ